MRDRLINELKKAKTNCLIKETGGFLSCKYRNQADCTIENIADRLLANGVIVLPCKVGDYIYYPWHYDDNSGVAILEVDKIVIKGETLVFILDPESDMPMPCWFSMDDFGKTVFLTKEEAERALKGREQSEY